MRLVIAPRSGGVDRRPGEARLEHATGNICSSSYSDDTFAPRDVGKFLVYLRDADMVVGTRTTRQMIEQGTNMRGIVRAAHVVLAKLLQLLWWRFECRFTDICCVYRALWRSTYATIRDNLSANDVEIFPEMVDRGAAGSAPDHRDPDQLLQPRSRVPAGARPYQTVATFARVIRLLIRRRAADRGGWE